MNPTPEIALAAALLLAVIVLVGLAYVLIRRGVRAYLMRDLHRRVERVQSILRQHEREQFARVDRLLFQLGDVRDREAVEIALREVLERGNGAPRSRLRSVYRNMGLVDHYRDRLERSSKWTERASAARALGQLGVVEAIPALVDRMRDPHEDVRSVKQASAEALASMGADQAIPYLLQELARPDDWASPRLAELLLGFGEKSLDPLQEALNDDESVNSRVWAAQILGRLGDRSASASLIGRLQDRSEQVRVSVTEALGRLADRRSIPELTRMALRDPVPTVRAEAARALGNIGDSSVLGELVLLLSSSDYWTRLRAVEAIEKLRPEDTFPLEQALLDDSKVVRGEAARALERLGVLDKRLNDLRDKDLELVRAASESLVRFGKAGAIDSLLKYARDSSLRVRARICSVLAEVGDAHALPTIEEMLVDDMWPVRARAAEAVGTLRPDNAIEILLPALGDDEEMVRIAAVGAIQSLDVPDLGDSLAALLELFETGNAEARCSVIDSIRCAPTEMVEALLLQALRDPDAEVRLHAVWESRKRAGGPWVEPLIELLADADERVRKEATRALGRVDDPRAVAAMAETLSTPDPDFREILTDMLAPVGPRRILEVVGRSSILEKRLALAWALGKTGDPEAVEELEILAADPEPRVRAAAAGAVSKIKSPGSRKIISALIGDPNERVRSAAVNGAGALGDVRLLPLLLDTLDDPNDHVRGRVAVSLGWISGDAALDGLDTLARRYRDSAMQAATVLGYGLSGTARGTEAALRIMRDEQVERLLRKNLPEEREEIRERFAGNLSLEEEIDPDSVGAAELRALYGRQIRNSRDDDRRVAAIQALGAVGAGDQVEVMLNAVASDPAPRVRTVAIEELGARIRDERIASALRRALRDPVAEVRLAAVHGLAGANSPDHNDVLLSCGAGGREPIVEAVESALADANAGRIEEFTAELRARTEGAVRAVGARVLGRIGDPRALELLASWLEAGEPVVRAASVRALGGLGTTRARDAMVRALSDPVVEVRLALAGSLARYPMEGNLEAWMQMGRDPSVEVRLRLAASLAGQDSVRALEVASMLAADPEESVRSGSLLSLLRIGTGGSVRCFLDRFRDQPAGVCREIYEIPEHHDIVESLVSLALGDRSPETRVTALEALDAVRKRPENTVIRAMQDPSPEVRLAAIRLSAPLDGEEIRAARQRLLRDPVREVRHAVRKGTFRVIRHPSSK